MTRMIVHYSFPKGANRVRSRLRKGLYAAGLEWDRIAKFEGRKLDAHQIADALGAVQEAVIQGAPTHHVWLLIDED